MSPYYFTKGVTENGSKRYDRLDLWKIICN